MREVDYSAVEEIQNCNTEDISLSASQLWIVNQAEELDDDFVHDTARELNSSNKDFRITHLNICSVRDNVEELRILQKISKFDILCIRESHLDATVTEFTSMVLNSFIETEPDERAVDLFFIRSNTSKSPWQGFSYLARYLDAGKISLKKCSLLGILQI